MSKVREKIKLTSYDELLGVDKLSGSSSEIEISKLKNFKNHPFKVLDDERMDELVESIRLKGVLTPILVRGAGNGEYELISGHRRTHAAKLAGLETIPAIVRELDDDEATILMVDANIQREEILPSEKAFAFKMKADALRHQGEISGEVGKKTTDLIGEKNGCSGRQVRRYIQLTNLIPEILELLDQGRITLQLALEITDLDNEKQSVINEQLQMGNVITVGQIKEIKNYNLPADMIVKSLRPKLKETIQHTKVTITQNKLDKYFPPEYTKKDMENVIYSLLQQWKEENNGI